MSDANGRKRIEAFWKAISKLEVKRNSRIFCILQCGDEGHICGPTFTSVLKERAKVKNLQTLELLLHSPGGHADIAYQIVRFFRRHCQKFNVIVPLMAKSAATLMCLGANAIYMGELAELGPIDVQIQDPVEKGAKIISPLDEFKSTEFLRDYAIEVLDYFTALIVRRSGMSVKEALHESVAFTTGILRPLYEQLDPLEIGEYKRSLAVGEYYADRLLLHTKNPKRREIVEALVSKYPSHEFAIDPAEARTLGLPVHAIPSSEETTILAALESIIENGDTLYGFPKAPSRTPATQPARSGRRTAVRPQAPQPESKAIAIAR